MTPAEQRYQQRKLRQRRVRFAFLVVSLVSFLAGAAFIAIADPIVFLVAAVSMVVAALWDLSR